MIDPFVILAPVLLLAVVALLRFVGCAAVLGLDDVTYAPAPPQPTNPVPTTTSPLDPPSKLVCDGLFTLKVFGTGFVDNPDPAKRSQVQWNDGSNPPLSLTTRLVSGHLEADVPANLIEELAPGPPGGSAVKKTVKVTVFNPAPGGGTSTPLPFDIVPGTPPNSVRFDPKPAQVANSGDILNGIYKNLDFGISQWRWELRPNGSVISLTTSAPSSFSFVNGERILASVVVFPTGVGQIKLSDFTNPDVQRSFTPAQVGSFQTVPTNWTKCAKTIKVEFSAAAALPILEIAYLGPP